MVRPPRGTITWDFAKVVLTSAARARASAPPRRDHVGIVTVVEPITNTLDLIQFPVLSSAFCHEFTMISLS